MKDLHSLRLQGYIDDLSLDCACEYTNLQLKKFLHTNIAYQQTLAIRLLNKRIGYQKDYQKQLKEMLDDNPAYYTKQEIEGFLSLINEKENKVKTFTSFNFSSNRQEKRVLWKYKRKGEIILWD